MEVTMITANQKLEYFIEDVNATRHSFFKELSKLPHGLNILAKRHIKERITRAGKRLLLGEYAPWLIADILGISDRKAVCKVACGWLHVYFFVLMLDDILDRENYANAYESLISGSLILQRGLASLLSQSSRPSELKNSIDNAFAVNARAALNELSYHRNRIKQFTIHEIDNIGQKIELLKICIDAIADICGDRRSPHWLQHAFENLATGIQLLDDITDWEEDLKAKNMTLPLTLAFDSKTCYFIEPKLHNLSYVDPIITMIESKALEDTLSYALDALKQSAFFIHQGIKGNKQELKTIEYIECLIRNVVFVRDKIQKARYIISKHKQKLDQEFNHPYSTIIQDPPDLIEKVITEIRNSLIIIAQDT